MSGQRSLRTRLASLGAALLLLVLVVGTTAGGSGASAGAGMALGLAAAAAAALVFVRRASGRPRRESAALSLVSRAPLSPRCGLALVEAEGRRYLVAFGDGFASIHPTGSSRDLLPRFSTARELQ